MRILTPTDWRSMVCDTPSLTKQVHPPYIQRQVRQVQYRRTDFVVGGMAGTGKSRLECLQLRFGILGREQRELLLGRLQPDDGLAV
ncbi:MAG TPA: hypothetical protein VHC20_03825, partial [Candidatus Paceibacterota bacterium]|nr:hypothetical protein [Candidatus Paceibacterota bacterium]